MNTRSAYLSLLIVSPFFMQAAYSQRSQEIPEQRSAYGRQQSQELQDAQLPMQMSLNPSDIDNRAQITSQLQTLNDVRDYVDNICDDVIIKYFFGCAEPYKLDFISWRRNFDNESSNISVNSKAESPELIEARAVLAKKHINALAELINGHLKNYRHIADVCRYSKIKIQQVVAAHKEILNVLQVVDQIEANDIAQAKNIITQDEIQAEADRKAAEEAANKAAMQEKQLVTSSTRERGRSQETGRSQQSQTLEIGGKINNDSGAQTLLNAQDYIRNIGSTLSMGSNCFALNKWRDDFDMAVNRGISTKVNGFYLEIESGTKLSDQTIREGKHYIISLGQIVREYANALISILANKEKFNCGNLNNPELARKYKEILNFSKFIDQIEANELARVDNLTKQVAMKAAEEENKKKIEAQEKTRNVQAAKDRIKKESVSNIARSTQDGPKVAKDAGVKWDFNETKDPMTDERSLRSSAIFSSDTGLNVGINFTCNTVNKKLVVEATSFDSLNKGVPFIQKNRNVDLLVRLNGSNPFIVNGDLGQYHNNIPDLSTLALSECMNSLSFAQKALLSQVLQGVAVGMALSKVTEQEAGDMLERKTDEIIAENPNSACINKDNNSAWLELTELRVQFPLQKGNVIARIAPYEPSLRKVLEACREK